jgi:hypothetical protein
VEEVEPRVRFAATMPAADVAHRPGRRWFGVNSAPVSVGVMGLRLVDLSGHLLVRENHGGRVAMPSFSCYSCGCTGINIMFRKTL